MALPARSSVSARPSGRGRRRVASLIAVAALVGVAAAGCGGGGIPLSSWRSKADEVCAAVQKEADQVRPVLFTPTLAETMRKSSELSKKEAGQLRDIEKPDEKRAEVRDYLASLDERARLLDLQASLLAGSGPEGAQPSFDELARATQHAASQAQGLGMTKCRAGVDMSVGGSSSTPATGAPQLGDPTTTLEPRSFNPDDPQGFGTEDGADG